MLKNQLFLRIQNRYFGAGGADIHPDEMNHLSIPLQEKAYGVVCPISNTYSIAPASFSVQATGVFYVKIE